MTNLYLKNGVPHFRSGKYKFKVVSSVPLSYLTWCISKEAGFSNEERGIIYDVIRSNSINRHRFSFVYSFKENKIEKEGFQDRILHLCRWLIKRYGLEYHKPVIDFGHNRGDFESGKISVRFKFI